MLRPGVLVLATVFTLAAWAQSVDTPSPAQRRIADARSQIAARPESAEGYVALATALARRARETSDTDFYRQADEAVHRALALDSSSLGARKARVWVQLGRHEFAAALAEAQALNAQVPDDVLVYGYLTDA